MSCQPQASAGLASTKEIYLCSTLNPLACSSSPSSRCIPCVCRVGAASSSLQGEAASALEVGNTLGKS